jgi:hypothetical protein
MTKSIDFYSTCSYSLCNTAATNKKDHSTNFYKFCFHDKESSSSGLSKTRCAFDPLSPSMRNDLGHDATSAIRGRRSRRHRVVLVERRCLYSLTARRYYKSIIGGFALNAGQDACARHRRVFPVARRFEDAPENHILLLQGIQFRRSNLLRIHGDRQQHSACD